MHATTTVTPLTTAPPEPRAQTPAVSLQLVTKVFHHRPTLFNRLGTAESGVTVALDHISLSACNGQALVLLGPNGSGKTTLLKLISTMLLPDSGCVRIHGIDTHSTAGVVRKVVGFAVGSERSFFPRLTARENLDFFAALENVPRPLRRSRIDEVLQITDLTEAADTWTARFSSGMFQKLGIARALLKRPSVLLLDEPSRSLDAAAAERFWAVLRELHAHRACMVLATHNFQEALAIGNTCAVLCAGRLAACAGLAQFSDADQLRCFYLEAADSLAPQEHEHSGKSAHV